MRLADLKQLILFDYEHLNTNSKSYNGNFYGFELPLEKNVDIDDQYDWEYAKYLKNLINVKN